MQWKLFGFVMMPARFYSAEQLHHICIPHTSTSPESSHGKGYIRTLMSLDLSSAEAPMKQKSYVRKIRYKSFLQFHSWLNNLSSTASPEGDPKTWTADIRSGS